jgi:hypothetical protein
MTDDRTDPAKRDFLDRAVEGDKGGVNDALVEMHRDPAQWFCSGIDPDGMPRVFGLGDTEDEARENARTAAAEYPRWGAWRFPTYAPDPT